MSRQTASCHEIDSDPQKTKSEEQKKALQMLTCYGVLIAEFYLFSEPVSAPNNILKWL